MSNSWFVGSSIKNEDMEHLLSENAFNSNQTCQDFLNMPEMDKNSRQILHPNGISGASTGQSTKDTTSPQKKKLIIKSPTKKSPEGRKLLIKKSPTGDGNLRKLGSPLKKPLPTLKREQIKLGSP